MFGLFNKKEVVKELSDRELADKLVERVKTLEKWEWHNVYHRFNDWQFHEKFYDLIPKWYMIDRSGKRVFPILRPLMKLITDEITEKELLRSHNVNGHNMTNEEFEYWYANISMKGTGNDNFENNNLWQKYYEKRNEIEKIHWWEDNIFESIMKAINTNLQA